MRTSPLESEITHNTTQGLKHHGPDKISNIVRSCLLQCWHCALDLANIWTLWGQSILVQIWAYGLLCPGRVWICCCWLYSTWPALKDGSSLSIHSWAWNSGKKKVISLCADSTESVGRELKVRAVCMEVAEESLFLSEESMIASV